MLVKFFSNPDTRAYLREIAKEFGESTNAVRVELNRLSEAKILSSTPKGRTIQYSANQSHPLFADIRQIVNKYLGLDKIAENIAASLGHVDQALVVGDYARGLDSGIIDLVLVGEDVDHKKLNALCEKVEALIHRKIRTLVLTPVEFKHIQEGLSSQSTLHEQFRAPIVLY